MSFIGPREVDSSPSFRRSCLRQHPRWAGVPVLVPFLALCFLSTTAVAAELSVGMISRVQNPAEVVSGETASAARVGTVVHMKDELRTGSEGRLQVTFRDNTVLTLGENATVVIDRYVFDPENSVGEASFNAARGALRFASGGKLTHLNKSDVKVTTPVAELGIRGTDFWSGPIYQQHGVYLFLGEVGVSNQGGAVTLHPGLGTDIASSTQAPSPPAPWSAAKLAAALSSTAFISGAPHGPRRGELERGEHGPPADQTYALEPGPSYVPAAILSGSLVFGIVLANQHEEKPASP